jgi:phosphatidylethanolamine-binding protein (PEBP) family uncharacterized protein
MQTNRIFPALAAVATAAVFAGCGGGSTATQSAGVSSLTTTSSVAPTSTAGSTSASASTSTTSSSTTTAKAPDSKTAKPATTGGTPPGGHTAKHTLARIAVASAAFPKGGLIPVRYTCEGAGDSPPLQWGKVPAGTSQLFLLALSLTAGAQGAIRWAVGGIPASVHGFGAGQLPAGAVVGRSSDGKVGWAGICPAKGKPQAIVVLLYALRHPLALTSGFQPSAVQTELSGDELGTGVVYGAAKKP